MNRAFVCGCKCIFGKYVKDDEPAVAACPLCGTECAAFDTPQSTARPAPLLGRDIEPFVSPIDRSVIGSRSTLREHEKRHNVVQIGTDKFPQRQEAAPIPRAGHYIKHAIEAARG